MALLCNNGISGRKGNTVNFFTYSHNKTTIINLFAKFIQPIDGKR